MSSSLPQTEINQRLIELRNIRMLYENQKKRIKVQEKLIKTQRQEITLLKKMNANMEILLQDFKLQIEELKIMVFGKKKEKSSDDDDLIPPQEKVIRTTDSYRRPVPQDEEVTETKPYPIDECCRCHGKLSKKKIIVFFEEDIPIPVKKIVRKHIVEKGYCAYCNKWSTAIPLPSHRVVLGNNIQKYICYLSVICRLSYGQIQTLLQDSYHIEISQGEIAKILNRLSLKLRPEYEQLKVRIRGEPGVGLDETGYPLFSEKGSSYAWVMTGMQSKESVYLLGENRGGGHTTDLLGENYQGFSVTDDFPGYKKLPNHQLCWAHLIRKFRDLANSKELPEQHMYYVEQYKIVAEIFSDVEKNRDESKRKSYTERLTQLVTITPNDCKKLIRIKTTLSKNISKYLTCLENPLIPLTNNQSERSLRHLVLKRKISFGSFCKRTADNLAVLLSILMSRKQRNPTNYFGEWVGV